MWPERPLWIEDDNEVLMRKTLFERLRGFVTYGSPLDKYAYLWPQIVNINTETPVFCENFEWINVFDHTDPVAAELKAYQEAFGPKKSPVNLAYKASRLLLWSHTRYLALKRKKAPQDLFARRLLDWMLDGKTLFPKPNEQDENWYKSTHAGIGLVRRLPVWILAALLLALLIGCVINPSLIGVSSLVGVLYSQADQFANATQACCELPKATDSDSIIKHAAGKGMNFYKWALDMKWINPASFVLIAASIFVALAGVIRYLLEVIIDKKHDVAPSRKKQVGDS